jgi:hypothetical protein
MKYFFLLFLLLPMTVFSASYYVAVNGCDTAAGCINSPFATIQRAQAAVNAGDTVWVRGGVYVMQPEHIATFYRHWAYIIHLHKSGAEGRRIHYWAFPGEKPSFDFSAVNPAGYRINAFQVSASHIHLKGLDVFGVQVNIKTHTQSICFSNEGNHNIFEQLVMRDGKAIGFYMRTGAHNLVLNCDAYNNHDDVSGDRRGGNVDGFGFHVRQGDVGNVIRGCRAWFNSDDGYDCINSYETVVFENCWAFFNGFSSSFGRLADGNGFKIGGYGQAPALSRLPNPIPHNEVRFCIAYRNKANGFYANHHVETGNRWIHNTAYRNSVNFNMLSQYITKSQTTGADTTIDCAGIRHVLMNNVSFRFGNQRDTLHLGSSTNTFNTFSPDFTHVVSEFDFESVDETLLMAPRQPDGSLPMNGFLRPKKGSALVDKGVNVGYPFCGVAPDLGAFEYFDSSKR